MSAKVEYEYIKETGSLEELFPGLTGDWEKDKKYFTKMYEDNLKAIKQIDINYE
jgi:hypothetical protein